MKQALQALLIAPDPLMRLSIMLGKKKLTIREGHRDYREGPVIICCHVAPWAVMTKITSVRLTTVAELTPDELLADGYTKGHQQALADLRRYYPNLTMTSPVTVIEWGEIDPNSFYADMNNVAFYAEVNGVEKEFKQGRS